VVLRSGSRSDRAATVTKRRLRPDACSQQKERLSLLLSYRYRSPDLDVFENVDRQNRAFDLPPDGGDDWWGEEKA
jgi:hypothetical protein